MSRFSLLGLTIGVALCQTPQPQPAKPLPQPIVQALQRLAEVPIDPKVDEHFAHPVPNVDNMPTTKGVPPCPREK
jgi:hypothetical protein